MFIKNNTVIKGKIYLKWEKHPYHYSMNDRLNKVHLNLGFIKLVSRVKGNEYDWLKINRIPLETNLKVKIGGWVVKKDAEQKIIGTEFVEDKWDPKSNLSQIIVCTKSDQLVGDIETGWWFVQNKLIADNDIPGIAYQQHTKSWIGFSQNGAIPFTYGDKIFESNWTGGLPQKSLDDIPFRLRGDKTISSLEEAKQAAINISKHIS